MKRVLSFVTFAAAVLMMIGLHAAQAQDGSTASYPNRPVKVVIPFAPGGVVDIMGRLLAQKLSEALGQNFYIENHGGAGGNIGVANAKSSPADGYTLLMTSSSFVVNPSMHKTIPYNPYEDFAPVTVAAASPNIIVVNPKDSAMTLKELIDEIKSNPGTYNFGSPGVGTTPHLSGEQFRLAFRLDMVHIPFTGAGPALEATVGGHTPVTFSSVPAAAPLIKSGTLRALAVTSPKRLAALPDVPTMTEAGAPGQDAETLLFVMFPARTPNDIVDLVYRTISKIVEMPDVEKRFDGLGFRPMSLTPEETTVRIKDEIAKWAKVIHDANIQPR